MRSVWVALMLCAVVLAGCTDDPDPYVPEECDPDDQVLCDPDAFFDDHYCTLNDVRPRVYAPDTEGPDTPATPWDLGRSWTYDLAIDGEDLGATELIYYGLQDNDQHYMVGTPTRDEALHHAVFSTNPVIGRVHRTLYSPHESGAHSDMFHFPLCDGSRWSDTFFATDFEFVARPEPVTLPDGTVDDLGFRIAGVADDGSAVAIRYSPVAKWFTSIDLDRADGTTVDMELSGLETGATGEAFFLRGQKDEVVDVASLTPFATTGREFDRSDGGAGPYDTIGLYVALEGTGGNGWAEVHFRAPGGETAWCVRLPGEGVGQNTACVDQPAITEVPFEAGTWEIQLVTDLVEPPEVTGEIRIVSIYDRSCTVGGDCES